MPARTFTTLPKATAATTLLCAVSFVLSMPVRASAQDDATPCERFGDAQTVFVGEAGPLTRISVRHDSDSPIDDLVTVPFTVDQAFRGATPGQTLYLHAPSEAREFDAGRRYLIYGEFNSGTVFYPLAAKPIEEASDDLTFLTGEARSETTGTLYGLVTHGSPFVSESSRRPLPGVTIHLFGEGGVVEVVTDEQGRYYASGLPPGYVRIEPVLPERLIGSSATQVRAGGCTRSSVNVRWNGRVRGRVLRPDQQPMTWFADLIAVGPVPEGFEREGRSVRTAANGEFEFNAVPPGDYVVGVNLKRTPQPGSPFVPSYYPGTTRREDAFLVSVGQGSEHNGLDFTLPVALSPGQIEVRLPELPGGGLVSVCVGSGSDRVAYPLNHDGDLVLVNVVEGLTYRLQVHVEGAMGKHWESALVDVVAVPGRRALTVKEFRPASSHAPHDVCGWTSRRDAAASGR
jgi:hypothetical protein